MHHLLAGQVVEQVLEPCLIYFPGAQETEIVSDSQAVPAEFRWYPLLQDHGQLFVSEFPVYDESAGLFVQAEHLFDPLALYSPVPQATQLPFDNSYFALQEILIVPPVQAPHVVHPVQVLVPTVEPPLPPVKLPVQVWVEPV